MSLHWGTCRVCREDILGLDVVPEICKEHKDQIVAAAAADERSGTTRATWKVFVEWETKYGWKFPSLESADRSPKANETETRGV